MSVGACRCRVLGAPKGEAFYVGFLSGFKHTKGQYVLDMYVCMYIYIH